MKKIISLFQRDHAGNHQVIDLVTPGAEWVLRGEGIATIKMDGTCCLIRGEQLYKRYDAKQGKEPPAGFEPAQDPDPVTGHWPGWLLIGEGPEDKYHREALLNSNVSDGTYELIGPKIQGNPYKLSKHFLLPHGLMGFDTAPPVTFDELKAWLAEHDVEGIVWHHPSGDMVKIKRRDFGLKWPV